MRTLVELATIELVGKWARVPYWQCLTLEQTHPDFQRQLRDWFDEGSPLVHNKLVQRSLISQSYLGVDGANLEPNDSRFVTALGRFQADTGMVVSGVVDFPTYERALRNFVTLGRDGNLVQIGWSPTNASPVALTAASMPVQQDRKIDMQIENVLVSRSAFEVGEQVFLSATVSRASYFYCFLQEASGGVMRLLPNTTNPTALISANQAIRIPDWMSPTPGFIMDTTSPGTERVACFATGQDATASMPQLLQQPALAPLPGVRGLESIRAAFAASPEAEGFTSAQVQWEVVPKTASATATAPAVPR